jgi:hypothetical protein
MVRSVAKVPKATGHFGGARIKTAVRGTAHNAHTAVDGDRASSPAGLSVRRQPAVSLYVVDVSIIEESDEDVHV